MQSDDQINASSVFVVSGGARGVTAQCVIKLVQAYQCKAILLGRSAIATQEPTWAEGCLDENELKKRIMDDFRAKGEKPTPMAIQKVLKTLLAQREVLATLRAIEQAGGQAEYINVDVTDISALQAKLTTAAKRLGKITGIIHGAGNLADKLIENKTEQDFDMVYTTKVKGLENLLRCIPLDQLEYLVLFSSVAGFYGNAGQSDYAIANEILNKSAHLIKHFYPKCHVVSINWGPWDSGMVTPVLKKIFAQRQIELIPLEVGAEMMVEELSSCHQADAQVIIGSPIPPMAAKSESTLRNYRIQRKLTLEANPFLQDHVIGQHPVLPVTCAASWLINTCEQLYPSYTFRRLENFKVLKGIVFDGTQPDEYVIDVKEIAKAETGEIIFDVLAWSAIDRERVDLHYRGQVKISSRPHYSGQVMMMQTPPEPIHSDFNPPSGQVISGLDLYQNGTLFHGPSFQAIEQVLDISNQKITLQCLAPRINIQKQGQFSVKTFNPYVTDALFQSILVWTRQFYQAGSLPLEFQEIEQFMPILTGQEYYLSVDIKSHSDTNVVADVTAYDTHSQVCLRLTNAKVTISKHLDSLFLDNRNTFKTTINC